MSLVDTNRLNTYRGLIIQFVRNTQLKDLAGTVFVFVSVLLKWSGTHQSAF
jgi:hypothetical protein